MGWQFRKSKKIGPVRLNLSHKGIGWSVGSRYIRFSSGASGRKSLRSSIPGTGLSYSVPLSRSGKRKAADKKTERQTNMTNRPTGSVKQMLCKILHILQWMTFLFCAIGFVSLLTAKSLGCLFYLVGVVVFCPIRNFRELIRKLLPNKPLRIGAGVAAGIAAVMIYPEAEPAEPVETSEQEPESVYTILADTGTETEAPDTVTAESSPETENIPPETLPPETDPPETQAPETKAPETPPPETKAPETKAPETKAPETETPPPETSASVITITHKDSSLSPEMVEALKGVAAFWAPSGSKIHLDPFCSSFKGTVYAGTVKQANEVKDGGWCKSCSEYANENSKSNPHATEKVIADCYSYEDYLNGIPAEAFD